jgi:hypothetical protein
VASVQIVADSLATSFVQNSTIDDTTYANLAVSTSNKAGQALGTIKYAEHKADFVIVSGINTGAVGTFTFVLTYKGIMATASYSITKAADVAISYIKIAAGSFSKTSFVQNETVTTADIIANLKVETYNQENEKLDTVAYSATNTDFVLDSVFNTGSVGTFKFWVTYKGFPASQAYTVTKAADTVVAKISLVDGTLATTYIQHQDISTAYNAIKINTYNAGGDLLTANIAYLDHKADFVVSGLSVAEVGSGEIVIVYAGATLKVAYTVGINEDEVLNATVASISITSGIESSYIEGAAVDNTYASLMVEKFNSKGNSLGYLQMSDTGASALLTVVTGVDTSAVATGKEFKVAYKVSDTLTIYATKSYDVVHDDAKVTHIGIIGASTFSCYVDQKLDFSSLAIGLYNWNNKLIDEVKYTGNEAAFTFFESDGVTAISTSTVVSNQTGKLKYGTYDMVTFTYNVTYDPSIAKSIKVLNTTAFSCKQGDTLDLADLLIEIDNAYGSPIGSALAYGTNTAKFTISNVDTSTIASDAEGKVTYTEVTPNLTATFKYTVTEKTSEFAPTEWSANASYTSFMTTQASVSTTHDGSSTFMKSAPFRIGSENRSTSAAPNLFPKVKYYDPVSDTVEYLNSAANVTVKLTTAADTATQLTLSDYFDNADTIAKTGLIDFKSTAASGDYILNFIYRDGAQSGFANIAYKITLVQGAYNVMNAKDMVAFNNTTVPSATNMAVPSTTTYGDSNQNFKAYNGIPETNFDDVVLQKDIAVEADDIPDCFIWGSKSYNTPKSDIVKGSLITNVNLYQHDFSTGHETAHVYGNYHKLTTGASFPFNKTESNDGTSHDKTKNISEGSACFFGENDAKNATHTMNISDLAATGNQGVTASTDPAVEMGLCFDKIRENTNISNCVLNAFYVGLNEDSYWLSKSDFFAPKTNVEYTRIHDSFSCAIYQHLSGTFNITNSEILNAGGPLIINECQRHDIQTPADYTVDGKDVRPGSWVNVDAATKLENWISGEGGWFNVYGFASAAAQLKAQGPLFAAMRSNTSGFVDANSKMNLVCLTWGNNFANKADGTSGTAGNDYGGSTIGTDSVINFADTEATMAKAYTDTIGGTTSAWMTALGQGGDFTNGYITAKTGMPYYKVMNSGVSTYLAPTFTGTTISGISDFNYLLGQTAAVAASTAAAVASSTYLEMMLHPSGAGDGSDYTTPTTYSSWGGANYFGCVMGWPA